MKKKEKKKIVKDAENIVHISENVDKKGIYYLVTHLPERLHKKFEEYWDKKNESWRFSEEEVVRFRKILKKRGFKPRTLKLQQRIMSLGEAIGELKEGKFPRVKTRFKTLDELLNGGFAKGSVTLVSGEPGAGKSTLANQLLLNWSKKKRCIYINTEETDKQVADRFRRLNAEVPFTKKQKNNLTIMVIQDINLVRAKLKAEEDAKVVILDSLGGFVEASGVSHGGVRVLRHATSMISDYIKINRPDGIAIVIGHINKSGQIAGPEAIQHMCDTILFIQGSARIRSIQATKNRFGPTSGMISVAMTETGLEFAEAATTERDIQPGQQVARLGEEWQEMS